MSSNNQINGFHLTSQYLIERVIYFSIAVIFLFRFVFDTTLCDLQHPVLMTPWSDNTYWLLFLLDVPQSILSSQWLSSLLDYGIILICLAGLIFRLPIVLDIILWILIALNIIAFASGIAYQGHEIYGALFIALILPFKNHPTSFRVIFESVRYYLCFIFVSAALWKVFRGTLFMEGQMVNILKSQSAEYLFHHPDSGHTGFLFYLINHPEISRLLLVAGALLQLSFLIGFFTHKLDRWLRIALFAFMIFNMLVMGISSWPLLVLGITLIDWEKLFYKIRRFKNTFIFPGWLNTL